jgi:hypothetical protein
LRKVSFAKENKRLESRHTNPTKENQKDKSETIWGEPWRNRKLEKPDAKPDATT